MEATYAPRQYASKKETKGFVTRLSHKIQKTIGLTSSNKPDILLDNHISKQIKLKSEAQFPTTITILDNQIQICEPKNIGEMDLYTKLYYENYKKRYENDYSLFVKNFYYYILSCVKCNKCENITYDVSPSDILCISIPDTHISIEIETNIYDCLNDMFKLEKIEYKCEKCNNIENNIIEKKIMNIPKTLIVKIKRYYSNGKRLVKNNKLVKYPLILDMEPYIISGNSQKYELYGIINHSGILDSGHYYSFIKKYNKKTNKFLNQWYCCNDSNVKEISIEEALTSQNAYILYYHYIGE